MGILLIILLFFILWSCYIFNEYDYIAPSFIFCFTFFMSACDAVINLKIWKTTLSINTVMIIVGGIITFTICSLIVHFFFKYIKEKQIRYVCEKERRVPNLIICKRWKLYAFLILQIMTIYMVIREMKIVTSQYGADGSLASAVNLYQYLSKFTTLDVSFSNVVTYLYIMVTISGYVWGYIIIQNYIYYKKLDYLVIFNFLISFISSFVTGSRGNGVQMILALIVVYFCILKQVKVSQIKQFKIIMRVICIVFFMILSFESIAGLMGRDDSLKLFEYISVYLGAPIKNLDNFIHDFKKPSNIWGIDTFSMQINWLISHFNINLVTEPINGDMQYINGYNLGNVYTAFKSYISDFGYIGVVYCTALMAIIIQLLYEIILVENRKGLLKNNIDCLKIVYGYLFVNMSFSFFSNKFYETFTITFIERIFFIVLIAIFIDKNKLIVRKKYNKMRSEGKK